MQNITGGEIINGIKLHEIQNFDVEKVTEIAALSHHLKDVMMKYNEVSKFIKGAVINDSGCNIYAPSLQIEISSIGTLDIKLDEIIAFNAVQQQLELLSKEVYVLIEKLTQIIGTGIYSVLSVDDSNLP